ncbi:DUF2127 domain-containing protein [Pseudostreptobacillus hongkongensis]
MKLDKKTLNTFLILTFLIIIFESMNSMYSVKSIELFEKVSQETGLSLNNYITIEMIKYFGSIAIFIIFAIYSYITYNKYRITTLYKGVWTLFIIGNILLKIFVYRQYTLFYFLSILVQFILIIYILKFKEREE